MAAQSARDTLSQPWESPKHADVTLRAGDDGAEMRTHSAILKEFSGVFAGLLSGDVALEDNVIPLSGKTVKELQLLCSFLYPEHCRFELVTLDNADAFCKMAQEYDMPRMLATVEEGLVQQAEQLMEANAAKHGLKAGSGGIRRAAVTKRFRLLLLADTCKMTRLHERIMHLLKAAPWAVRDMAIYSPDALDEINAQTSTMQTSTAEELLHIMSIL